MKKRLFALVALMLCAVMMLSSCALFTPAIKFKKFVNQDYQPEIGFTPTSFKKLDFGGNFIKDGDSYDESRYRSDLVILSDSDITTGARTTTTVYNMATDTVIWSGMDSMTEVGNDIVYVLHDAKSEIFYIDGEYVALAIVETVTETLTNNRVTKRVYDIAVFAENGDEVLSLKDVNASKIEASIFVRADLFFIQQKVYRVSKDGSVEFAFDWSDTRAVPSIALERAGDFYVACNRSKGEVLIYDRELNLTAIYVAPIYDGKDPIAMGFQASVLSNGNVLVQYDVLLDAMAKEYTYLFDGEKYKLCSLLIEAKSGKIKELDLDYRIYTIMSGFAAEKNGISEKVENVAIVCPIEDQRIDLSELAIKMLSLKNNGRVAGVLDVPVTGAALRNGFEGIAHNRWQFETVDNRNFIVDETGDVIGVDFKTSTRNTQYFITNGRIYDWNLDVKYELTEEDDSVLYVMNHSVLIKTKKGEVKLYVDGEIKTLINEAEVKDGKRMLRTLCGGAYMIIDITSAQAKYEIYNDLGVLLGTITDSVGIPEFYKITKDGVVLLCAQENIVSGKYYRLG